MISYASFKKMALSFPEAVEVPHFEKPSFRVRKKIFVTYDAAKHQACLKLSPSDQDVFSASGEAVIFPVSSKWGKQGWTLVDLRKAGTKIFYAALAAAYCEVAPTSLSQNVRGDGPADTL